MTEPAATAERFDPTLLAVLSSRMTAILREMTNIVVRTSRSSVIKTSRDFSCGIVTYDHRQISCESGLPVHLAALSLTTRPISEFFDDVKEGDAYVNNCSYTGGTHHADIALCVPVFCDAEPLFWTVVRAHHADIGAPEPTTYLPYARTIYEEGLHFPCVRFQEHYEDKADLIRLCRMQIRVADVWYGDYRAQVGACRTAERRLKELVAKYGLATVKAFIEAWIAYGERRMIAAIRALPAGTWSYETRHDPVPTVADEGVPVRATLTVDPEAARITVDVRDNMDCVPGGINQSETCATAGCLIGVYNNLDPTIPHNEGSASRGRDFAARRLRRRPPDLCRRHLGGDHQRQRPPVDRRFGLLHPDGPAPWPGRGRLLPDQRARRDLGARSAQRPARTLHQPVHARLERRRRG